MRLCAIYTGELTLPGEIAKLFIICPLLKNKPGTICTSSLPLALCAVVDPSSRCDS